MPWGRDVPHPYLVDWIAAPIASPPGRRALVVGAGLGEDARWLASEGFDVVAVDVSPSAIDAAQRRSRRDRAEVDWRVVDVLDPTASAPLVGTFDLVVEIHTVPYLPGVVRDAAMTAIGGFVAARGVAVVVTWLATDAETDRAPGPPWPQAPSELTAYRGAGLVRLALEHPPAEAGGPLEVRVTWQRPAGVPEDVRELPRLG